MKPHIRLIGHRRGGPSTWECEGEMYGRFIKRFGQTPTDALDEWRRRVLDIERIELARVRSGALKLWPWRR